MQCRVLSEELEVPEFKSATSSLHGLGKLDIVSQSMQLHTWEESQPVCRFSKDFSTGL